MATASAVTNWDKSSSANDGGNFLA
jgi:hypothetical protein